MHLKRLDHKDKPKKKEFFEQTQTQRDKYVKWHSMINTFYKQTVFKRNILVNKSRYRLLANFFSNIIEMIRHGERKSRILK